MRATSQTRLKARDHCILRSLIGRKGQDRPSSLQARRRRLDGSKKVSWMESLHGVMHGRLWGMFRGLLKFASDPPSRDRPNANSGRPYHSQGALDNWYGLWMGVKDSPNSMAMALGLCVKCPLTLELEGPWSTICK